MRPETKEERKARWAKRNREDWIQFKRNVPLLLLFFGNAFGWLVYGAYLMKTNAKPVGTEVAPTNVSRPRASSDPVQEPWVRTSADPKFVAPPQEWETEAYKQRERDRERDQEMMMYQATQPPFR